MTADQIFNKVFKGSNNFMAPDVLGRSMIGGANLLHAQATSH